jgi:hypothetical protein
VPGKALARNKFKLVVLSTLVILSLGESRNNGGLFRSSYGQT